MYSTQPTADASRSPTRPSVPSLATQFALLAVVPALLWGAANPLVALTAVSTAAATVATAAAVHYRRAASRGVGAPTPRPE